MSKSKIVDPVNGEIQEQQVVEVAPVATEERRQAFEATVAAVQKKYGKGAIQTITKDLIGSIEEGVLSTGIPQVDRATRIGGFPRGRIIEIYGPESSGKTTLCLHTIAECQRKGGITLYVDAEHALEPKHVDGCGVVDLNIVQPDNGDEGLDVVEMAVQGGGVDLIVVDSVSALVPKEEIDAEMGKSLPGLQARLMSQALRKLTSKAAKSGTTVIFINQIRYKIGVTFGNPETTSGGNALKFYASMRLDMRKGEQIKRGEEVVGQGVRVTVRKSKAAAPLAVEEFKMFFNAGETIPANLIEFGTTVGVIQKSGSWYSYNGERIGQGLVQTVDYLKGRPELVADLLVKSREHMFDKVVKIEEVV